MGCFQSHMKWLAAFLNFKIVMIWSRNPSPGDGLLFEVIMVEFTDAKKEEKQYVPQFAKCFDITL